MHLISQILVEKNAIVIVKPLTCIIFAAHILKKPKP